MNAVLMCNEPTDNCSCTTQEHGSEGPDSRQSLYQPAGFNPPEGPGGVTDSRTLLQNAQQQGPGRLQFFNPQLTMNEREKITESLLTGTKVKP